MDIPQTGQLPRPVTGDSGGYGPGRVWDVAHLLQRRTCQSKQEPHPFASGCGVLAEGSVNDEFGECTLMLLLVSMVVEPPRRAGYRAGHPGLKGLRSLRDGPAALDPGTSAAPVGHAGAGAVRAAPVVACRWANARVYP
jgi:hypothetical protein